MSIFKKLVPKRIFPPKIPPTEPIGLTPPKPPVQPPKEVSDDDPINDKSDTPPEETP